MFPEVISVFNRWLNGIFLCFSKPLVQGRCTSNSAFSTPNYEYFDSNNSNHKAKIFLTHSIMLHI